MTDDAVRQGALLLVLFNVSHTIEHVLTDKARDSLTTLLDQIPQQAALVSLNHFGAPNLTETKVASTMEIAVGSTVLVKPGEQVQNIMFVISSCKQAALP